jgi:hypothetical protein
MRKNRKHFVVRRCVVTGLLAAALPLGACGDDENAGTATEPAVTATADPDISGPADNYFTLPAYIGRTVTVQGPVIRIIGPTSFVMDASRYGEDALLVISAPAVDAEAGKQVQVTGVIQPFEYEDVTKQYGLGEDFLYTEFEEEEILVVGGSGADSSASANAPSPAG